MANKTVTVKTSGGDYTSLNAALVGESANLVTNTCILTIECYSMEDTTPADTGTGYTTNSSYYINITVPMSERHDGKWNDSKYVLKNTTGMGRALFIYAYYTVVDGLQVDNGTGMQGIRTQNDPTPSVISNCIIKNGAHGIFYPYTVYNCIIYDISISGLYIHWVPSYIYNCTFVNCTLGVDRGAGGHDFATVNCLFSGCTDDLVTDTQQNQIYNNATDLSTGDSGIPSGQNNRFGRTFLFVDSANDDYHLTGSDEGARTYGMVNPAAGLFYDDIDGVKRGYAWDIGADNHRQTSPKIVTVKPSAGDYTSLNSALIGEEEDIVSLGYMLEIDCYSMQDTYVNQESTYTTNEDYYIKITTPPTERHNGKWDENKYHIVADSTGLRINANHTIIDGLQLKVSSSSSYQIIGIASLLPEGGKAYISNNIIWGEATGDVYGGSGIYVGYYDNPADDTRYFYVWNNIVYGFNNNGNGVGYRGNTGGVVTYEYVYNNTIANCRTGFAGSTRTILKNNIGYNNTYDYSGSVGAASSTNNLSKDASAPAYNTYYTNKTLTFVNATIGATSDFHLVTSDTDAIGKGTNLSADSILPFSTDIDGVARGTTWDIGADQYVGGVLYVPQIIMIMI